MLLARQAERRPTGDEVLARLGDAPTPPIVAGPEPPFVGRAKPLAALADAFALSRRGQAVAVFVGGPSGIGKTTLVRRFLDSRRGPALALGQSSLREILVSEVVLSQEHRRKRCD